MDASTSEDPSPDSTDFAGWKRAAQERRLDYLPLEAIIAALQDLRFNTDFGLRNDLAKALSDRTYKLLRGQVGRNHPNGGADIIDRVHVQVFEALAQANSADAKGFRQAFVARLVYRLKDAIAKEARERRIPGEMPVRQPGQSRGNASEARESAETGFELSPDEEVGATEGEEARPSKTIWDSALVDGVRAAEQQIDRFLEINIADDRKRLAFRLFMDELPFKSTRSDSIAKALGIDESTARQWIKEIQVQLIAKIGDLA